MIGWNFLYLYVGASLARPPPQNGGNPRPLSPVEIAQKECYETEYWLELLFDTGYIPEPQYRTMQNNCGAIRRMLIASLTTIKGKQSEA